MGELPEKNNSVSEGIPAVQLSEVSWQKWVNKGKELDAARRKRFIRLLWVLVPALILLSLWLALRQQS
jgi:hypothetical protein